MHFLLPFVTGIIISTLQIEKLGHRKLVSCPDTQLVRSRVDEPQSLTVELLTTNRGMCCFTEGGTGVLRDFAKYIPGQLGPRLLLSHRNREEEFPPFILAGILRYGIS